MLRILVLISVVVSLSGCGWLGFSHNINETCEVGDTIRDCTWNFPNGVTVGVTVKAPADAYVTVKDDDVYGADGCKESKWLNPNVTESSESCAGTLEMNGVKDRYCCIKTESDGNAFVLEAFSGGSHPPEGVRIRYENGKFVREQYP